MADASIAIHPAALVSLLVGAISFCSTSWQALPAASKRPVGERARLHPIPAGRSAVVPYGGGGFSHATRSSAHGASGKAEIAPSASSDIAGGSSAETGLGPQDRQGGAGSAADDTALGLRGHQPSLEAAASALVDAQSKTTLVLQGGEHVGDLSLLNFQTIDIVLGNGGGSLDLGMAHPQTIVLTGEGEVQIPGIAPMLGTHPIVAALRARVRRFVLGLVQAL
jgi:hypothetical protein